jgi:hypothetical protein
MPTDVVQNITLVSTTPTEKHVRQNDPFRRLILADKGNPSAMDQNSGPKTMASDFSLLI